MSVLLVCVLVFIKEHRHTYDLISFVFLIRLFPLHFRSTFNSLLARVYSLEHFAELLTFRGRHEILVLVED